MIIISFFSWRYVVADSRGDRPYWECVIYYVFLLSLSPSLVCVVLFVVAVIVLTIFLRAFSCNLISMLVPSKGSASCGRIGTVLLLGFS